MDKSIKEKVKDKKDNKIQTIGVKNNDTNKRRIIVNDKKGCTQTAYVGSLVTMLVLHDFVMSDCLKEMLANPNSFSKKGLDISISRMITLKCERNQQKDFSSIIVFNL